MPDQKGREKVTKQKKYIEYAANLKKWTLSQRQICDIELILNGAFHPLNGFVSKKDYQNILENMRLQNGTLWPMPITLDVTKKFAENIKQNEEITLLDHETNPIAIMKVKDIWQPDKKKEAHHVYNTNDPTHPAVRYLNNVANEIYLGGEIKQINQPKHYDFIQYIPTHTAKTQRHIQKK